LGHYIIGVDHIIGVNYVEDHGIRICSPPKEATIEQTTTGKKRQGMNSSDNPNQTIPSATNLMVSFQSKLEILNPQVRNLTPVTKETARGGEPTPPDTPVQTATAELLQIKEPSSRLRPDTLLLAKRLDIPLLLLSHDS